MSSTSLDVLLDKLNSGDPTAAEQAFLAYEPYLRKVVRRLLPARLRTKFDSVDIVQSAWGDLLTGFRKAGWRFADANHLRAFLVRATRNRFIDRYRQLDRIARAEERLDSKHGPQRATAIDGGAGARLAAEETWSQLLDLCPPEHHPILHLRRAGVPLDRIADETGLHPGSIRRILRNLACQFAADSARAASEPS
jgi:RNA polymerase sigma-70 factor (ECF subfamily)